MKINLLDDSRWPNQSLLMQVEALSLQTTDRINLKDVLTLCLGHSLVLIFQLRNRIIFRIILTMVIRQNLRNENQQRCKIYKCCSRFMTNLLLNWHLSKYSLQLNLIFILNWVLSRVSEWTTKWEQMTLGNRRKGKSFLKFRICSILRWRVKITTYQILASYSLLWTTTVTSLDIFH
jgi:hypothetical protein